jgi:hypothetical protein
MPLLRETQKRSEDGNPDGRKAALDILDGGGLSLIGKGRSIVESGGAPFPL